MLKQITSKVSEALFAKFGEKSLLIKPNGDEFEILSIQQSKTFDVGDKLLTTAPNIRIQSETKPELYDQLKIGEKTYKIKAPPRQLGTDIYEIKISSQSITM
ncbi:MAG: hypothetical protein GY793_04445 [Proteobacteria bacterium]|nr:hypothetical protein [Pseudomonadota bacterium]